MGWGIRRGKAQAKSWAGRKGRRPKRTLNEGLGNASRAADRQAERVDFEEKMVKRREARPPWAPWTGGLGGDQRKNMYLK